MLVSAIVATIVSIAVSLLICIGATSKIDKLEKEIEILKAIAEHK